MQTSSNAGNRGNSRRSAQGGASLKKSARPTQTAPEEAKREEERPPLLMLARRIREEQGTEGLRAFIIAMEPFAAPYELKNIAARFGMEHHTPTRAEPKQGAAANAGAAFSYHSVPNGFQSGAGNMNGAGGAQQNAGIGFDPNLFRMMQMMNGMGQNGGNMNQMMQLVQMMRLIPMLQNMGKGGQDPSQILKMFNL